MYIKKSIISGFVMTLGGIILAVLAILFCFTEIQLPGAACISIWIVCIWAVRTIMHKIER